ncbi:translation initiation factor IF-3 [Microgenomates group bacterium RBG_16_45_19]|nr:MAG: translation initiation factor IF-3 [Microgenomates group bacterium RBG_16_45_19]
MHHRVRKKKATQKIYYQINHRISVPTMRVVDDQGHQLGVMSKEAALKLAIEENTDLVLVAQSAQPPVAKIIDFAKFKYQQQQKESSSRKSSRSVEIKEIMFTPFIAEGDFQNRIKRATEFLEGGDKVKLNVKFVGRQITHPEFGHQVLNKAIDQLKDLSTIERVPNLVGKILSAQLQPKHH